MLESIGHWLDQMVNQARLNKCREIALEARFGKWRYSAQHRVLELTTQYCGPLRRLPGRARSVKARHERVAQGGRQRHAMMRRDHLPGCAVEEHAGEFFQIEGDPIGLLDDAPAKLFGQVVMVIDSACQISSLLRIERSEGEL